MKHTRIAASLLTAASTLVLAAAAHAQDRSEIAEQIAPDEEPIDEIIVHGIRGSIQESLEVKRNNNVISDALVGVEIGDLPDLSIAESLERITGVTSDRFKGGASSISVRGLGDYLGFATLNGREVSSGSDGRGVNYGQFPSELFDSLVVYKSQQASLIEGGVSGVISLNTLRPLDYAKRRISLLGLAGYSEYEDRVADGEPFNYRLTGSYIDQFETGIGDIGISVGGQIRQDTAPEDIFTTSSTYRPCFQDYDGGASNCEGQEERQSPTYLVSNQYIYRAMSTEADRDAVMASVQWQPNRAWDVNADFQYSDRYDLEDRANLVIADGRRRLQPIAISPDSGALLAWQGETRLENQSVYRERAEEYVGGGLNVSWENDFVTVTGDFGYSRTERRQDERDMRIRTDNRVAYTLDRRDVDIPALTILDDTIELDDGTEVPVDLNDYSLWENAARARPRLENIDDEVMSFSLTSDFRVEGTAWTNIRSGIRLSTRERVHDDGIDENVDLVASFQDDGIRALADDAFPVEDLFEGADTPMRGLTFTTWDSLPLFAALTGDAEAGLPAPGDSTLSDDDTDVTEDTFAFFVQGDFATELFGLPMSGNIGTRVVRTQIESVGVSRAFVTQPGDEPGEITLQAVGDAATNTENNQYWNVLPSANVIFELSDRQLLRLAAYRAIARNSMEDLSAGLDIPTDATNIEDLAASTNASGNPQLDPLSSWNADLSYEWYYTDDTSISVAGYYKLLETGLERDNTQAVLEIDGRPVPVTLTRFVNSDESSDLYGVELSAQHVFSDLPGLLGGLGFRAGVNWAETDFEYPDPVTDLAGLTKPLSLPGYSRVSGNATVFWENDDVSLRLAYKGRSGYNKPFRLSSNRFTGGQEFLDFSATYDVTDTIELRFQGLNLLDEPNVFYRPVKDSFQQADYSGRRWFFGARARF